MLGVGQNIFDIFYPIGTYYETSDTNFNPNTAHSWYGTWVEDTEGQTLVSRNNGTFATVGANIGEEKHLLISNELPGYTTVRSYVNGNAYGNQNWGGPLSGWGNYQNSTIGQNSSDQPHNNIQPSKVVIRWHRTA